MITAVLTFVFFFAIVGCVLYGRKLIKTEKVDAVFGNPERAKGGAHWVIVGSSFLLLIWLYYSWDIAKSFFPKSANELCQVGKINESLLSLKYLFPIEERQLKSTSKIETETENLNKISINVEKSNKINSQDKDKLLNFINQTKNTIPLLTSEKLLENETREKVNLITNKINNLTDNFNRKDFPNESPEEEVKRMELAKQEGTWGASSTSIENTIEIPSIPKTKKGLKFQAAAMELNIISDEFFEIRNHNPQYTLAMETLKKEIKVEDFGVGFYTKYGDGGVDISPIADCTKTEVWEMGNYLGIPKEIIEAEPTDGLWDDGRSDVKQLGMSYHDLEKAMKDNNDPNYKKYLSIREKNLHKMLPIPVCKFDNES